MTAYDEPIDIVYTWVDGAWPGYAALLQQYAESRHDTNPNRYRDNLQLLKFSLRSVARFAPWARRIHLVTCRPQMPVWLDTSRVHVVHHDEFIPANHLPTFNSFAILSNLHRVPGVTRRFVYLEDDRLFGRAVSPSDFFDRDGRTLVYQAIRGTPRAGARARPSTSPWNRALSQANALLDARYGEKRRASVKFAPLAIDCESWARMIALWPAEFERTSASRFRAADNVAPEHLYPYYLLAEGLGRRVSRRDYARRVWYHPIDNVALLQRIGLARLRWFGPPFACLNDNFGERPDAAIVAFVRNALERWFPNPSPFERTTL